MFSFSLKWALPRLLILLALVIATGVGWATTTRAAPSAAAPPLFIAADTVQGSKNVPANLVSVMSCVMTSRFPRNSEIVWRARVFDPNTGDLMDDKALSKVEVKLANGQSVDMRYGGHPPRSPNPEFYWTGSWLVPKDSPTGTLRYTITATSVDGRTGTWEPFAVDPSIPTILDEALPDA